MEWINKWWDLCRCKKEEKIFEIRKLTNKELENIIDNLNVKFCEEGSKWLDVIHIFKLEKRYRERVKDDLKTINNDISFWEGKNNNDKKI